MTYTATYSAGDLTNMGIDTAGGVMHSTASQSGNVASLGIFGGAVMPQVKNVVAGSGSMLTAMNPEAAKNAATNASDHAKHMCESCKAKK